MINNNIIITQSRKCHSRHRVAVVLPTSLATSPETLHNANSLRPRCNASNRSAAEVTVFWERSVNRSARWILNTAVAAVVAISDSTCAPNAGPLIVSLVRPFSLFLKALIACNSVRIKKVWDFFEICRPWPKAVTLLGQNFSFFKLKFSNLGFWGFMVFFCDD